ncbi:MAG: hypothetical protein R2697_04895 [Ilumatobacteraceae bacterium]
MPTTPTSPTSTSGSRSRTTRNSARGSSTRRSSARTTGASGGAGVQGVLDEPAADLQQGCCSYGAHFVDEDDVQTVVRAFVRTGPEHMQFHGKATKSGFLRAGDGEGEDRPPTTTRVVDGACIFLNRPGFEGGAGCSLHLAAEAAGERPIDWKPNVCWQLPVRLEHFTDDQGHVVCGSGSGNGATGATAAPTSPGGAPRHRRRSRPTSRSTGARATRSSSWSVRWSTTGWSS